MRSHHALLGSIPLLLALTACGTLTRQQLDPPNLPHRGLQHGGNLQTEVDALAQPLIDSGHTPGLVVGVLSADGRKQVFGYGITDRNSNRQPDGSTLFAVGSLSKGFVGDVTALLVQDGLLRWDDSLEQLLPTGTPLSEDARKITLLQLATHTAGLPRQPMTPQTLGYFIGYLFTGRSFYRHFDETYLLRYLADFDGGERIEPQYSNIGYALLSHVLELHSGRRVDELVQERILAPLGLHNTGYQPERLAGYPTRARGHAGDQPKFIRRGRPVPDWQFTDILQGSAALYSNVGDLLDYAAAHLHASPEASLSRALEDTLRVRFGRPREAAAVAWIVDEVESEKISYQVGLVAGYSSYLGLDTRHKTAVVVLQNSFNWTNGIGHRLLLRMADELDAQRDTTSDQGMGTISSSGQSTGKPLSTREIPMFRHPHKFEINYIYRNDPRAKIVEADSERFPQTRAARYLIELHHADAENSLVMPSADASEEEVLEQAQVLGISDIRVTRLDRTHKPGTTPGHYQQP